MFESLLFCTLHIYPSIISHRNLKKTLIIMTSPLQTLTIITTSPLLIKTTRTQRLVICFVVVLFVFISLVIKIVTLCVVALILALLLYKGHKAGGIVERDGDYCSDSECVCRYWIVVKIVSFHISIILNYLNTNL